MIDTSVFIDLSLVGPDLRRMLPPARPGLAAHGTCSLVSTRERVVLTFWFMIAAEGSHGLATQ